MPYDSDTEPLKAGDHFGDYVVERQLGSGAMGAVYLVRAPDDSQFAIKVMLPGRMTHDLRSRFAREADFAMKIRHKNLISVYDVGEDPDTGLCYIIMDYVPGGTLADRIKARGKLPVDEAVKIALQIAAGLDVAHKNGLVHRDVKPDNIMFDASGTPKLADLGVAKFDDDRKTMVTMTGMVIGTPAYMSPEQLMDSHRIDARADIYSLGVVLYEMLSGTRPNSGSTAVELLAKAIKGEPLPDIRKMCPEISAAIAHVLSLMCAPKPEDRPATSVEAANLLHKAATGRLTLPKKPPKSAGEIMDEQTAKRKRAIAVWMVVAGLLMFLVVGLAGITYAVLRYYAEEPTQAQSAATDKDEDSRPIDPLVVTNVIEKVAVVTNVVEKVAIVTNIETTVAAMNAMEPSNTVRVANGDVSQKQSAKQSKITRNGITDRRVRYAKVDGITWTYTVYRGEAHVGGSSYAIPRSTAGAISIPATLGGYIVTRIEYQAFSGCRGLTSVTIPNSVTDIGHAAFWGCSGLTSVTIPCNVTSIGDGAFLDCSGLKSFTVAASNPSYKSVSGLLLTKDGTTLVAGVNGDVTIPNGVTRIGPKAFKGYDRLTSVTIPSSVTRIGDGAFQSCDGLISFTVAASNPSYKSVSGLLLTKDGTTLVAGVNGDVTIPDGVTRIGDNAFLGCRGLASVTIPDGVKSIGGGAFRACWGLTRVTIPGSVTNIGDSAFGYCGGLISFSVAASNPSYKSVSGLLLTKDGTTLVAGVNGDVTIPDGVTRIGADAFSRCTNLTRVAIPDSVASIGDSAFSHCTNLTNVMIPSRVTSIGEWALSGCSGLTRVTIPSSVTRIEMHAFSRCINLTSVTIPGSVTSIGMQAFEGCSGLTSVSIPSGVTRIGPFAFRRCSGLTRVTIPSSVTSIGREAFNGCNASLYDTYSIPGVKLVDGWALSYTGSLSGHLDLTGVRGIGERAFEGCSGLRRVRIPDSVKSIGWRAFDGCNASLYDTHSISGVKLVDGWAIGYTGSLSGHLDLTGVRGVGDDAFRLCGKLAKVTIPSSVTRIGDSAFACCSRLMSFSVAASNPSYKSVSGLLLTKDGTTLVAGVNDNVTIPNGVTCIGDSAFFFCSGLTSVTIPSSVTRIGDSAFSGCSGLTSVTIPDSVTSIGGKAFYLCRRLMNITFEGNAPTVGSGAFDSVGSGCTACVRKNSTGWRVKIPGTWEGIAMRYCDSTATLQQQTGGRSGKAPMVGGSAFADEVPSRSGVKNKHEVEKPHDRESTAGSPTKPDLSFLQIVIPKGTKGYSNYVHRVMAKLIEDLDSSMGGSLLSGLKDKKLQIILHDKKSSRPASANGDSFHLHGISGHEDVFYIAMWLIGKATGGGWGPRQTGETIMYPAVEGTLFQDVADDVVPNVLGYSAGLYQRHNSSQHDLDLVLKYDPQMDQYDFNGKPIGKQSSRKTSKQLASRLPQAKIKWVINELSRTHDAIVANYFRARHEARLSGLIDTSKDLSLDDFAALMSIAAQENLFRWFSDHGMSVSPEKTKINAPKAVQIAEPSKTASVKTILIFPNADVKDNKWKMRTPWRYTTKWPNASKWFMVEFDDGKWNQTRKPVGIGKEKDLMRIADKLKGKDRSVWLRRHFSWKPAAVHKVIFHMCYDSTITMYLNGEKILERDDPNTWWQSFHVSIDKFQNAVREGDNVLAICVNGQTSLYFDCGMMVEVEDKNESR